MNVFPLFVGFVFGLWGVNRGSTRPREFSLHSATAVPLFGGSLVGCFSAVAIIVTAALTVATFDETRDMNPALAQAGNSAASALRIAAGTSFILQLHPPLNTASPSRWNCSRRNCRSDGGPRSARFGRSPFSA